MTSLHIFDDVLDYESRNKLVSFMQEHASILNGKSEYVKESFFSFIKTESDFKPFFEIASQCFDISSAVGYEHWYNVNHRPLSWHIDKDENKMRKENIISLPLCTILYYPKISEDLVGGQLFIRPNKNDNKDVIIQPKTNRLIVFSSGTIHAVENFKGERYSLVINPWSYDLNLWASGEVGESQQTVNLSPIG